MIRQKQFSPLLRTEANPYLSIDMERFAVIPAVPGEQDCSPTTNVGLFYFISYFVSRCVLTAGSAVPAPSQTAGSSKARVPKTSEVREDENILAGFSPVPAVPQTTASNTPPAPPAPAAPAAPPAPPAPTPRYSVKVTTQLQSRLKVMLCLVLFHRRSFSKILTNIS